MSNARSSRPEIEEEPAAEPLDVPLSVAARKALDDGLASARRGEVRPWGDFTRYIADDE